MNKSKTTNKAARPANPALRFAHLRSGAAMLPLVTHGDERDIDYDAKATAAQVVASYERARRLQGKR